MLSVQNILFYEWGSMAFLFDSVHFQHFSPFYFNIFMTNYQFKKCWCAHFLKGGGGPEKGMVLYTPLNVDNYGRPLTISTFHTILLTVCLPVLYCIIQYARFMFLNSIHERVKIYFRTSVILTCSCWMKKYGRKPQ